MAFIEPTTDTLAKIRVIGVGGAGQNAIDSMIDSKRVRGVEFIAMNTDLQVLNVSNATVRIQLGPNRTHGLGAGSDPTVGFESAQESYDEIKACVEGSDMIFIAAGMGGGTGTGGVPVIAKIAKESGALTVGVVTKPFEFEGKRRMAQAEEGIKHLKDNVDALIVIPDERILEIVEEDTPFTEAFKISDQVIGNAVEGISDLITSTGLVNVDFADVKSIMEEAGSALMGIGQASGENRAENAAKQAIKSPLLDVDIKGSIGILINIVGDNTMTMHEVNKSAKIITEAAHEGANIIFGANIDDNVDGMRITVIATGFDSEFKSIGISDIGDNISIDDYDYDEDKKEDKLADDADKFDPKEFDINKLRDEVKENEQSSDVSDSNKRSISNKIEEDKSDKDSDDSDASDKKNEDEDGKKTSNFWKSLPKILQD